MLFNSETNVIYAIWTLNPASKECTSWEYADCDSKYSKDCNEYNHECGNAVAAPSLQQCLICTLAFIRSYVLTC